MAARPGAFVLSLDFELHWGVRERVGPGHPYWANVEGERDAVAALLDLFRERGVAATWATVGLLFASSRSELASFAPARRPRYQRAGLDPYTEILGEDEANDPFHYAGSLVERIRRTPRQEVATHTFSHYYCLEPGQDELDFDADLRAAVAIAKSHDIEIRSIVFPRNQWAPSYASVLKKNGILAYRGNARGWAHAPRPADGVTRSRRAVRYLADHLPPVRRHWIHWNDIPDRDGLCNVAASHFFRARPGGPEAMRRLHLARMRRTMTLAARAGGVAHLWWHPHNFGRSLRENIADLEGILDHFDALHDAYDMRSLSMIEVAEEARRTG